MAMRLDRVVVKLTKEEAERAAIFGVRRAADSLTNRGDKKVAMIDKSLWTSYILGCLGECAVAKHLGLKWDGVVGHWSSSDLPGGIEVKVVAGDYRVNYLHLQKENKGDRPYFLVAPLQPERSLEFAIIGWEWGKHIMQDIYWGDHYGKGWPCYRKPDTELRPVSDFHAAAQ